MVAVSPQSAGRFSTSLPTPRERPEAEVVIYDGQCRICCEQIERLSRWDTRQTLAYLSLHDPEVAQRYPDLTFDQLMREMVLVDRQGRRHPGVEAILYLTRRLPRLWPLVPVLHLPGTLPIWRWMYRRFANLRYRIGGRTDCDDGACSLHVHK
jgi:predicted DCC family thiol-disulfide oxidoreductase YuxK